MVAIGMKGRVRCWVAMDLARGRMGTSITIVMQQYGELGGDTQTLAKKV